MTIMLECAKYDHFAVCPSDMDAQKSFRTEAGFVQFYFSQIRRLGFTVLIYPLPGFDEDHSREAFADAGQPGHITCPQVQNKGLHQPTKSGLTDPGKLVVSVLPFTHRFKCISASSFPLKALR